MVLVALVGLVCVLRLCGHPVGFHAATEGDVNPSDIIAPLPSVFCINIARLPSSGP